MIPLVKPYIAPRDEMMPQLEKILYSGYIAAGETVDEFEQKFGEYIGNKKYFSIKFRNGCITYCVAVNEYRSRR